MVNPELLHWPHDHLRQQETVASATATLSGSYDLFFELSEEAERLSGQSLGMKRH